MITIEIINKTLWIIAISLILINSFYFSIKLHFPQFRIFQALKTLKYKNEEDNISPKDTLIMTLSSKIGVGSLSGTALCIYYGGIGSVFWIFISTFILSIINYIENALAIIYKENNKEPKSGPQYYIKKGLNKKILSIIYAIVLLISYILLFTAIQTNTISVLIKEMYNINRIIISLVITILTAIIIKKGIKGISNICNKIFPVMMSIFIIIGGFIILKNINMLPCILKEITKDAFNIKSISGGIFQTIIITFQRSVFANEAGVGTSAIISGSTDNNDYHLQANIGLLQTYFINFIILGITSLIIITSKQYDQNIINGIELTKAAFQYHLGSFGGIILLVILTLFSFSSIITIYYYGESSLDFLIKNKKSIKLLKIVTLLSIFIGGIIKATAIWNLIDIFLAILTIINMYSVYSLKRSIILKLSKK